MSDVQKRELFVIHDGKQTDAPIHEAWLAEGDGKAEEVGRAQALRSGLTKEQLQLLFPRSSELR